MIIIEVEVEVTRIEKVRFEYNPDDLRMLGLGQEVGTPMLPDDVGRFLRLLTFYTHKPKNLALGEKVALRKYRVLSDEEAQRD